MDLLEVRSISKTYGSGETAVHALKDVSFSVPKGEFVAIVGDPALAKPPFSICLVRLTRRPPAKC